MTELNGGTTWFLGEQMMMIQLVPDIAGNAEECDPAMEGHFAG